MPPLLRFPAIFPIVPEGLDGIFSPLLKKTAEMTRMTENRTITETAMIMAFLSVFFPAAIVRLSFPFWGSTVPEMYVNFVNSHF